MSYMHKDLYLCSRAVSVVLELLMKSAWIASSLRLFVRRIYCETDVNYYRDCASVLKNFLSLTYFQSVTGRDGMLTDPSLHFFR